jgi:hypothetical protein
VSAPNVPLSDLPALARAQLRALLAEARVHAQRQPAHWNDLAARVEAVLDAKK